MTVKIFQNKSGEREALTCGVYVTSQFYFQGRHQKLSSPLRTTGRQLSREGVMSLSLHCLALGLSPARSLSGKDAE